MSQYLHFYLKEKQSETSITLGYFCTTPARQIDSLGAFPYTESDTLLDADSVKTYLVWVKNERNKCEEYLKEKQNEHSKIEQSIYKCASREVAQMFLDNIDDIKQGISEWKEELDLWDYIVNKISFIIDVWKENNENWDLYYSNC